MKAKTNKRTDSKKKPAEELKSEAEITEELCKSIKAKQKNKPVNHNIKPVSVNKQNVTNNSNKQVINGKKPVRRDSSGHILPGSGSNGGGRPKGSLEGVRVSEIRQCVAKVALERRKPKSKRKFDTWLEYQINKSYDDTSLATTIFNKIHPTLKAIEQVSFDGDLFMGNEELADCRTEYRKRFNT